jgi:hypothetical protein
MGLLCRKEAVVMSEIWKKDEHDRGGGDSEEVEV